MSHPKGKREQSNGENRRGGLSGEQGENITLVSVKTRLKYTPPLFDEGRWVHLWNECSCCQETLCCHHSVRSNPQTPFGYLRPTIKIVSEHRRPWSALWQFPKEFMGCAPWEQWTGLLNWYFGLKERDPRADVLLYPSWLQLLRWGGTWDRPAPPLPSGMNTTKEGGMILRALWHVYINLNYISNQEINNKRVISSEPLQLECYFHIYFRDEVKAQCLPSRFFE